MSQLSPQRKTIPYWLTLLIGVVVSCILTNAITISSELGIFTSWTALNSPPAGAKRIIDANFRQVWIESQDSKIFTAELFFNCENKRICWKWEAIQDSSEIPKQDFPVIRGNDCEKLQDGISPSNPKGPMVECVYAHFPGPEFGEEGYFALMADGNVLYWQNGGSLIMTQALFAFSTFIVPFFVAVIISAVYFVRHIIDRRVGEKVDASPGAG